MKAAIYSRVSTRDKGQDPENQLRQIRDYIARRGWDPGPEYIDRKSGKTADRAAFQQLFKDGHKRLYDVVVFWSLDRFSRAGVYETIDLLRRLEALGVGWVSYQEEYLDSTGHFKEAIIAILAALAKQERERLGERVRAGIDRAKADAKAKGENYKGGRPATPPEVIKRVYRLIDQGVSPYKIAKEKLVTYESNGRQKPLSKAKIYKLLKNRSVEK